MYRSPNTASTPWLRTIRSWSAASARFLVCRLWRSQEGNTPLRNCLIPLIKGSLCHYRYFIHVHQIRSNYTRTGRRSTHWQFETVDATMRHWSVMLVENQVLYDPGLLKPGFLVIYAKTCTLPMSARLRLVLWYPLLNELWIYQSDLICLYRYNNDSLFNLPFYLCIFRKHVMLSCFELGLVATRLLSLLQRSKNTRPQFISLAYKIGQANICHTRIVVTRHGF